MKKVFKSFLIISFFLTLMFSFYGSLSAFESEVDSFEGYSEDKNYRDLSIQDLYNFYLTERPNLDSNDIEIITSKAKTLLQNDSSDLYASALLFEIMEDFEEYVDFVSSLTRTDSLNTPEFKDFDVTDKNSECYLIKGDIRDWASEYREYYVCFEGSTYLFKSNVWGYTDSPDRLGPTHFILTLLPNDRLLKHYANYGSNWDDGYQGSSLEIYDISSPNPKRIFNFDYNYLHLSFVGVLILICFILLYWAKKNKNKKLQKGVQITLITFLVIGIITFVVFPVIGWLMYYLFY